MNIKSTLKVVILLSFFSISSIDALFAWTTPTQSSPTSGSTTNGGVTIDWNAVSTSAGYQYQVDTLATFNSPVKIQGTLIYINSSSGNTDTQFTFGNTFYYGKTYYWRVRAYISGDTSSWSSSWTFITPTYGPALLSPATGTTSIKVGTTLDWNSHYYVTAYDWQADTVSTFNSSAKKQGSNAYVNTSSGNTDTQVTLGDLFYGKTYYWRVRSRNNVDTSAWTTAWTFTTTASGPSLLSPATGTTGIKAGTTLDWDSHYYVTAYDWQVDTVPTFNSSIKRQGTNAYVNTSNGNTDTQVTLGDFFYGKTYYWRVRSRNNVDTSAWTTAWTFTTTASGPTLLSPATGTTGIKAGTTLDWDSHYYVTAYDWQADTVATFNSSAKKQGTNAYVNTSNGNTDTQVTLGDFFYGKTYYWRVRSRNNVDTSAWTTAWTFTITLYGPTLLTPSNGQINISTAGTTLDWDSHYYIVKYQVEADTNNHFNSSLLVHADKAYVNTSSGNSDTQHSLTSLLSNTIYYWRVRSMNNVDTSEWTPVWAFNTGAAPAIAPTLISPANNAISIAVAGTTLQWSAVTSATSYTYQLDDNSSFTSPASGTTSSLTVSTGSLLSSTTYYWKVRAVNASGNSPWSGAWHFTTACNVALPQCNSTSVCDSGSVVLTATGSSSYNWYDAATGGNLVGTTAAFTTPMLHATDTFYVAGTNGICESNRIMVIVNVFASPAIPVVSLNGIALQSTSASSYQWMLGGSVINGATLQNYTPTANGLYTVVVTNSHGCSSVSSPYNYSWVGLDENITINLFEIYPNPATDKLFIDVSMNSEIEILNAEGQILKSMLVNNSHAIIDISGFAEGLYFVKVKNEAGILLKKVVKE